MNPNAITAAAIAPLSDGGIEKGTNRSSRIADQYCIIPKQAAQKNKIVNIPLKRIASPRWPCSNA